MKIIGYLEGTNPLLLSEVVAKGYGTMPLSNGWDNHGKFVGHISKGDGLSVVIGYLHKVMPLPNQNMEAGDVLYACRIHDIPVLLIAPKKYHKKVAERLGEQGKLLTLTDPEELPGKLYQIIGE